MNRQRRGPAVVAGLLLVAIGLWMLYSTLVRNRMPGAEYRQITRTLYVFDADDAVWNEQDRIWMIPARDPLAEPPVEAVWEEATRRWVQPARDPETGALIASDVAVDIIPPEPARVWNLQRGATPAQAGEPNVHFSWQQTFGLWFAAICTLFVLSFLYRDNIFYKFAEALVVGVSAAYGMVVGFWTMVMPNLFGKLWPDFIAAHILPEHTAPVHYSYLVVLLLSIMLLWRLSPKGGWIARWPLAFIIGITAGFRLVAHLEADFAIQIQATILPLVVRDDGTLSLWLSLRNTAIVLSVFACLTYFFFSIEHRGVVGRTAKVGIWVLMVTFGAGFAYTVMGRITLLTQRIEFLLADWLRLID
jgi:hypothetical protein